MSVKRFSVSMARFRAQGVGGLLSRKRGQSGNRKLPTAYTEHILALVRERYADFGPTLAREKLLERHGILIGGETLRGLMRDARLWLTRVSGPREAFNAINSPNGQVRSPATANS
jgi:hypothetical protein